MAQVIESPVIESGRGVRGIESSNAAMPLPMQENQEGFDILKVLWRWKWLPVLGAIVGCGIGYLYFTKQPEQFKAEALVRLVDSLPPSARLPNYEVDNSSDYSVVDESRVVKSQKVLSLAVEQGNLTEQSRLRGMKSEEIVAMLLDSKDLVIQPAGKDSKTTLLEISYVCEDADLAADVVNAVVDGYSTYLSEEFEIAGNEIYKLVTEAQEQLEDRLKKLIRENDDLKDSAPSEAWTGDDVRDVYAENLQTISTEISQLKMEKSRLLGTLTHVQEGIAAGRPAEQILLMLSSGNADVFDSLFVDPRRVQPAQSPVKVEKREETESERLRKTTLADLEMKKIELLERLGAEHPSVQTITLRIGLLEERIQSLEKSEEEEKAEYDRLLAQAEEEAKKTQAILPSTVSVDERLKIRTDALKEEMAALQVQQEELIKLAQENREKSRKLQTFLRKNRLLDSQVESVGKLLEAYTEKVGEFEILPDAGQRTLKALNLPSIGGFYGPNLPPYLLGGAAVGFIILSGLAVLMDLADRSYRSPDEIAADLGMPVLGHIPIMDTSKVKKVAEQIDSSLTTIHHSRGRVAEAFRTVRTGLFFSSRGRELKVIQVTSPVPGDGKSTLSSNLAVTMAQSGRRVLLIDADFRRPRVAKLFGIEGEIGMAAVTAGNAEIDEATYNSGVANLSIMPGGKRPSNPAELLSSNRFNELLEILREKYDMVIVDTPPLLAVSDPGAVAAMVDGVVLTMRLRRNVKPLAMRATKILESVDSQLLGVVVNGVSAEAGYGYSYGYNDYRYSYRYGGNYKYGYKYGQYSAGYIDDRQDAVQAGAQLVDGYEASQRTED